MRLPKSLRLARWGDFARVRTEGRSVAGRYLVLGAARNAGAVGEAGGCEGSGGFRVGFVTSKKVGNAVVRNLVRRRLRAVVREFGGRILGGMDVVTVARYRAGSASYEELRSEWCQLARRLGILAEGKETGGEGQG